MLKTKVKPQVENKIFLVILASLEKTFHFSPVSYLKQVRWSILFVVAFTITMLWHTDLILIATLL